MGRPADRDAGGGRHRAAGRLPRRPAGGADRIRADLEHQAAHQAWEPDVAGLAASLAVLRRVRDALASGGQP
jgi:hypothetical protein